MKVVFLGVGGGVPTLRRSLPAVAVRIDGRILLFDCGEGTQIQLQRAQLSLQRISEIYISHLHGDHCLGLPGLLSTMVLLGRSKPLAIFGPRGIESFVKATLELTQVDPEYELTVREVDSGIIFRRTRYTVECLPAIHSVPALSFILRMADRPGRFNPARAKKLGVPQGPLWRKLQSGHPVQTPTGRIVTPREVLGAPRKGVAIAYSGDTAPNPQLVAAARGVALLIHDATYTEEHAAKAAEYLHSTAAQAAQIAKEAGAQQLALIHISPRYEEGVQHEKEAQRVFLVSYAPEDLDVIELSDVIPA